MSILNAIASVNVDQLSDMTAVKTGGGGRGLLPKGTALVRLCSYIEFGSHIQTFAGQAKPAAPIFKLGFMIVGGVGLKEDGTPEKYVLEEGKFPMISTFDTTMSLHEKAKAVKYFNALNRVGNKATHFVQKIQEQCLYALPIGHKIATGGRNAGKTVQDIDFAALQVALDQETGLPRTAPELKEEHIQVFLWNQPSEAMWNSIYIEGEWDEVKDEKTGEVKYPKRSKNFLQEKCLAAVDFEGSALQVLLSELGTEYTMPELPTAPEATPDVPAAPTEVPTGTVPAVPALDDTDDIPF